MLVASGRSTLVDDTDVIRIPLAKQKASQLHLEEAQAIAVHDVDAAREAASRHMLYIKQRMFPKES